MSCPKFVLLSFFMGLDCMEWYLTIGRAFVMSWAMPLPRWDCASGRSIDISAATTWVLSSPPSAYLVHREKN